MILRNDVKIWEIDIKGSFPAVFRDAIIKRGYSDIGIRQYGKLIFEGTENEYEDFYSNMIPKDERYMKVIGERSFDFATYNKTGKLILKAPK